MSLHLPSDQPQSAPLSLNSRIADFWTFYGGELGTDAEAAACASICLVLKRDFGCITIGCMQRVLRHTFTRLLAANGGKAAWVSSIESLLGITFDQISSHAPDSARLALSVQPDELDVSTEEPPARPIEKYQPKFKLGPQLIRRGNLKSTIVLPSAEMRAAARETQDPATQEVTYNDSKAITTEAFKYMGCAHDYVSGDKIIFDAMGKAAAQIFPIPHGLHKKRNAGLRPWEVWARKLSNRFKHGRAPTAQVRPHTHTLAPLPISLDHDSACRRFGTRA